jgi:predicted dienelactone hydrolase
MMKFQLKSSGGRTSGHPHTQKPVDKKHSMKTIGQGALCTLCFSLCWAIATPTRAAERLTLRLGPFEQSVAVTDLENFAQTGELSPSLKPYGAVLTPQIRQMLNRRLQIDPNMTEKFLNDLFRSSDGAKLLERIGLALPDSRVDQLKAALFLAARQADGLNVIGFLKAYPEESVTIDASSAIAIALQFNTSYWQSLAIGPMLEKDLTVADDASFRPSFDPTEAGSLYVREQTLLLRDRYRERTIPVDLYWTRRKTSGPLVVLSHGFGSDRNFLNYIARHLASYGFTVASIEHPGSNFSWLSGVSLGGNPGDLLPASEFIDRPKDISFVLDRLTELDHEDNYFRGKLNTEQVTVIGHSLGGYTALALAGGELNLKELRQYCKNRSPIGRSPADWFQCAAAELSGDRIDLRDNRVVQVMALNPMTGRLFGNKGLSKVTIPTLILTSTEDAIAPSLDHQLRSFSQLGSRKYLLSAIGGTHLSVTDRANLNEALAQSTLVKEHIGEEVEPLRRLLRGVSLAFVKQLTPDAQRYQPFLSPVYAQTLSTRTMRMRLSKELPTTMSTWFQVLAVGNQQVAIRLPRMNEFSLSASLSAIRSFFFPANSNKVLTKAQKGTEQFNQALIDLIHTDDNSTTKLG